MEKQAIVLAGGLGTRLRSVVADLPKCMAPVKGKPFLHHVIRYLKDEDVDHIIFSLGYMHEVIEKWLIEQFPLLSYSLVIENEPLGTGGAIWQAMKSVTSANVLVLNGDTMFRINTAKLLAFHNQHHAACTLALKPMHHFDRYGIVDLNKEGYIQSFREKQYYEDGLINGGVYALNAAQFRQLDLPEKFSFEKDYLEIFCSSQKMMGLIFDDYFIDIGIPEDLARADVELNEILNPDNSIAMKIPFSQIDKTWTLFLDRDGVINYEKEKDYIHSWDEFKFYDGVKEAMKIFASVFNRIIVVTNQKGVGKGLTKLEDLHSIHANMRREIELAGGRIDTVFYCSDLEDNSPFRKPNPGMGLAAAKEFPEIDLSKTIMIGNTLSDMEFGKNLGAYTIFLPTTRPEVDQADDRIDHVCSSLLEVSEVLAEARSHQLQK